MTIADYGITPKDEYVIAKIMKCTDKYDYYINFNRNKEITSDNVEGDNIILVIRVPSFTYTDSELIIRLGVSEEYVKKALLGGNFLAIKYKSLQVDTSPISATVQISRYSKCKSDFDCNDFDPCTTSKCLNYDRYGNGMCSYSVLSCSECGTDVKVTLITNELENKIYWKIESKDYNRIIMASESNLKPLRSYSQLKCLTYGTCKFIVNYD